MIPQEITMKKLKFVVSLTNDDNDYQIEQAASAERAARKTGVSLQILYAQNDPILQSQQLLKIIQSNLEGHPDGIIFEPAGGTAMPQVAQAAVAAGIGWVVLNRETEYLDGLRNRYHVPAFAITSDHEEIGRIQGRQLKALLPKGGSALYIQGPAESLAAKQRTIGLYETKPANVDVKLMKAQWTESSAHKAVTSWLKLATSQRAGIDAIAAQDDSMAMGARRAFEEIAERDIRDRWLSLPFIGCDGMPQTGQAWVKNGILAATIYVPPNAGQAIEMLANALNSHSMPPEQTLTVATSIPALDALSAVQRDGSRGATAGSGV